MNIRKNKEEGIFFGVTKEEAEQKVIAIKKLQNMTEEEKEFEEFKIAGKVQRSYLI